MIDYLPGTWGICFMFRHQGSVIHKGLAWGVPSALLSALLNFLLPDLFQSGDVQAIWSSYTTVLGFLVVFKNNHAYSRFWDGSALVQRMRGEWLNAVSSLIAFSSQDPEKHSEVAAFQHLLVRLMSMLHCAALQQIAAVTDDAFEIIHPYGIEESKLMLLANHQRDRCDIMLQWLQRLIVDNEASGTLTVAPPILSRVYQELSRGRVNLQDARRIKEIPYPFPYAQLTAAMMLTHTLATSIFASQMAANPVWAACLTLCVVTVFWSLLYIAKELEQPFGEDMNDLPVGDMQREMNNSLALLLNNSVQVPPHFTYSERCHDMLHCERSTQELMMSVRRVSLQESFSAIQSHDEGEDLGASVKRASLSSALPPCKPGEHDSDQFMGIQSRSLMPDLDSELSLGAPEAAWSQPQRQVPVRPALGMEAEALEPPRPEMAFISHVCVSMVPDGSDAHAAAEVRTAPPRDVTLVVDCAEFDDVISDTREELVLETTNETRQEVGLPSRLPTGFFFVL